MACSVQLGDQHYNLGGLDATWTSSIIKNTPPSHTNLTWYVNPCGAISGPACPPGSLICGVEEVQVDDKSLVTEIIPVALTGTDRQVNAVPGGAEGVRLSYSGEKWGDIPVSAEITYVCRDQERNAFTEWNGSVLKVEIETPSACLNSSGKQPDAPSSSGGWGFFSFLFFLIVIAFVAFVGVAIAQNRRITDVGPLSEIVSELPYLLKELWSKIVGTFSSERRGGYSAV